MASSSINIGKIVPRSSEIAKEKTVRMECKCRMLWHLDVRCGKCKSEEDRRHRRSWRIVSNQSTHWRRNKKHELCITTFNKWLQIFIKRRRSYLLCLLVLIDLFIVYKHIERALSLNTCLTSKYKIMPRAK